MRQQFTGALNAGFHGHSPTQTLGSRHETWREGVPAKTALTKAKQYSKAGVRGHSAAWLQRLHRPTEGEVFKGQGLSTSTNLFLQMESLSGTQPRALAGYGCRKGTAGYTRQRPLWPPESETLPGISHGRPLTPAETWMVQAPESH